MEKPKKIITPDYVQGKLKQGWTMQNFCEDLGVSEEFLLNFINKHSNNRIYGTFQRLVKQNEQLAEKKRRNAEKKSNSEAASPTATEASPSTTPEEKASTDTSTTLAQVSPKEEVETDPIAIEINSLSNKIKRKESDLTEKLKLKSQLSSEQESLLLRTVRTQNNVDRLEKELELERQNLSKASHRLNVVTNHMVSVDKDIENIESAIKGFNSKIRELQKISIFVSENGEITLDKKVEIPDSWRELYPKLLEDSIVENITVKQVQQLAKLLVLFELLKKEEAYFEFIFELDSTPGKDSVKTLFELFTEKHD